MKIKKETEIKVYATLVWVFFMHMEHAERWNKKKMGKMIAKSVKVEKQISARMHHTQKTNENVIQRIHFCFPYQMWEQDGMTTREFIITQLHYISSLNKFGCPSGFSFLVSHTCRSLMPLPACDDEWDAVGGPISKSYVSDRGLQRIICNNRQTVYMWCYNFQLIF